MFFGSFQSSGFQNNAFQIKAYNERPSGGTDSGMKWWPKEYPRDAAKRRIEELPDVVQAAIEKAAVLETPEARAEVIRHDLAGIEDRFIRVYLALMERLQQEQLALDAWNAEQMRLAAIRQQQDDDAIVLLLLSV